MLGRNSLMAQHLKKAMVRYYARPGGDHTKSVPMTFSTKYKITAKLTLFFGIGLGAPWLVVRHQMLKNSQTITNE